MNKEKLPKLVFNSPAILGFSAICLVALVLGYITHGWTNIALFSVYRGSLLNPLTYIRFFGHIFGHANWDHFINNIMMILILGPLLEEKYGTKDIIFVMAMTALVTGIIHVIFFPYTALLGASGVVFSFILLASMTNFKNGTIPITFILVAIMYIGGQIYQGLFVADNVSNLTHIVGGLVGAASGYLGNTNK